MGLEKAIEHHKEHRKKYYGAKRIDPSCRNHGNCPWCKGNRTYQNEKLKEKIKSELKENKNDLDFNNNNSINNIMEYI